jgi:hypothetical protein
MSLVVMENVELAFSGCGVDGIDAAVGGTEAPRFAGSMM